MRIRCERCKAEYEVDETQMRGGRLEVQCSVCAHVFSVSRQADPRSPSPAPEEGLWLVQTTRGSTQPFASLAAVQQGIQEGKLHPQDKLTRDRHTWQALAEVAELAPYFGAASARRGSEPHEHVAANETTRFVLEPKSHGVLKIGVGLAVAAGVAFAGIRWQQDRNLRFQSGQAHAAMPTPSRRAAPVPIPSTESSDPGETEAAPTPASTASHRPVIEELPATAPAPAAKKEPHVPASSATPTTRGAESHDRLVAEADRALENGANIRARDLYQKALNLRPSGYKAMVGLGFVALDRGQLPVAYDYFKRALTAKTSYPPAIFGIAEVHRARGEKRLAVHTYQRYLDMSPNGADAPAARRQLQNLQAGR